MSVRKTDQNSYKIRWVVTALVVLLVFPHFKPRSQAVVIRSWSAKTGTLDEAIISNWWLGFGKGLQRIFLGSTLGWEPAPVPNRYYLDGFGEVKELRIRSADLHSLSELPGIERMTGLRLLNLMGN